MPLKYGQRRENSLMSSTFRAAGTFIMASRSASFRPSPVKSEVPVSSSGVGRGDALSSSSLFRLYVKLDVSGTLAIFVRLELRPIDPGSQLVGRMLSALFRKARNAGLLDSGTRYT